MSTQEIYAIYNISEARGKVLIDYVHYLGYSFRNELIKSDLDATRNTRLADLKISANLLRLFNKWQIYTINDFMVKDINMFRLRDKVGIKTYGELRNLYIRCSSILRQERDNANYPLKVSEPVKETILSKQFKVYEDLEHKIKTLGKRRSKLLSENAALDLEIENTIREIEATKIVNGR